MSIRLTAAVAAAALLVGCQLLAPESVARGTASSSSSSTPASASTTSSPSATTSSGQSSSRTTSASSSASSSGTTGGSASTAGSTSGGASTSVTSGASTTATSSSGSAGSSSTSSTSAGSSSTSSGTSSSSTTASSTSGAPFTGFVAGPSFTTTSASFIAAGDLNGDGIQDLVAGTGAAAFVEVLSESDGGYLAELVPLADGGEPVSIGDVAIVDWDGDGRMDLVLANDAPAGYGEVFEFRGDGLGSWVSGLATTAGLGGNSNASLARLAVVGAPNATIYALASTFDGLAWLDSPTAGSLAFQQELAVNPGAPGNPTRFPWVTAGDFVGDGGHVGYVAEYLGGPDGGLPFGTVEVDNGSTFSARTADGTVLLACASPASNASQTFLVFSEGSSTYVSAFYSPSATGSNGVAVPIAEVISLVAGDINGDGVPDAVIGVPGNTAYLVMGEPDGGLEGVQTIDLGTSCSGHLVLSDLDGDGRADLATTCGTAGSAALNLYYSR